MIDHWQNFKVAGKYIFGSKGNVLYRYEIAAFRVEDWTMPPEIYKSKSFNFSSSRLYALMKGPDGLNTISVYSIH
jgi:hypothetical protein